MREALDSVATGRTLVVIAHRLSTVVDSDLIIVLDGGRVVGQGTHEELVKAVPLYRELAQHQLLVPEDTPSTSDEAAQFAGSATDSSSAPSAGR